MPLRWIIISPLLGLLILFGISPFLLCFLMALCPTAFLLGRLGGYFSNGFLDFAKKPRPMSGQSAAKTKARAEQGQNKPSPFPSGTVSPDPRHLCLALSLSASSRLRPLPLFSSWPLAAVIRHLAIRFTCTHPPPRFLVRTRPSERGSSGLPVALSSCGCSAAPCACLLPLGFTISLSCCSAAAVLLCLLWLLLCLFGRRNSSPLTLWRGCPAGAFHATALPILHWARGPARP